MSHSAINPQSIALPAGPYFNNAILAKPGRLLSIAGQAGFASDGKLATGFEAQTKAIWEAIKAIVEEAGGTMGDLVSVNVYLKDASNWALLDGIRKNYLVQPYPASTAIAGIDLVLPGMEIEISALAIIPD